MRPGFGLRHPRLLSLLEHATPLAAEYVVWPGGLRLNVTGYDGPVDEVPDELVTSVRCITSVQSELVVCETPDGLHVWPGGRRQDGETHEQTASREVHEETGWLLDSQSFRPVGFLHMQLLDPQPEDHPFPHPDFVQVVCIASASEHAGTDPAAWADLDGWETRSMTVEAARAVAMISSPVQRAFMALVSEKRLPRG